MQEGLKKHSSLSTQLRDHVWTHYGRGVPASDILLELRPPPGCDPQAPEPPWAPSCGNSWAKCKYGYHCAMCHSRRRALHWGPSQPG